MTVANGNYPQNVFSNDVSDIVPKHRKIHSPIPLAPQAGAKRISLNFFEKPIHLFLKTDAQPALFAFVIIYRLPELDFRIVQEDDLHRPYRVSNSLFISSQGRLLALPESISAMRRSISSSQARSISVLPGGSTLSRSSVARRRRSPALNERACAATLSNALAMIGI